MIRHLIDLHETSGNSRTLDYIEQWCILALIQPDLQIPESWDLSLPIFFYGENNKKYIQAFYYERNNHFISSPIKTVYSELKPEMMVFEYNNSNCNIFQVTSFESNLLPSKMFPVVENIPVVENMQSDDPILNSLSLFGDDYFRMMLIFGEYSVLASIYKTNSWVQALDCKRLLKQHIFETTPTAHHQYYQSMGKDFFAWLDNK
jgi:hypothetical protein